MERFALPVFVVSGKRMVPIASVGVSRIAMFTFLGVWGAITEKSNPHECLDLSGGYL